MSGMDRLTDEALANVAALLRDDLYMQQCDGLSALLKTAKQAASAIDELLSKRKLRYMGKIHGVDTFVATDASHRRASQAAPAPSDPTPTRAEVAISIAKMLERKANAVPVSDVDAQLFLAAVEAIRSDEALRERAEAADSEYDMLHDVYEATKRDLTAARRAEAAAWNDAIEAAADKLTSTTAMIFTLGDCVTVIRALRRAAPMEGEA